MAKSVTARRQGDEFQSLFFWSQLIKLLTDDNIKSVTFEHHQSKFVDDVVVKYFTPILEGHSGIKTQTDYYQCKYHVSQDKVFSVEQLIDPKFIHSKESMLKRLYSAYTDFKKAGGYFRLYVVSSSGWDTWDPMCRFISPEGNVRETLFEGGSLTKQGKIISKLSSHLGISLLDLKHFLGFVRFDLGTNRIQMLEKLNLELKLAGLEPIDQSITDTKYASLAWKLLEQGTNTFDREVLKTIILREKLESLKNNKLFVIRHQSLHTVAPYAIKSAFFQISPNWQMEELSIDQTDLVQQSKLTNPMLAVQRQQELLKEFYNRVEQTPIVDLGYYGIAHVPLVFLLGYQFGLRKKVHLFEHNRKYDNWNLLQLEAPYSSLVITGLPDKLDKISGDVVVTFSLSYLVDNEDVLKVISNSIISIEIRLPVIALDSVRNHDQLEEYAQAFRGVLDQVHNMLPNTKCIHVFYAGPVSLAFRCGQLISPTIHPRVLVYNYFVQDNPRYKWGLYMNNPILDADLVGSP